MKSSEFEKGKIEVTLSGPVPIVNPRLMRTVPSNISRVIGNFDEIESGKQAKDACLAFENK